MKLLNRKARHEFHILETFEVGIVLSGPEVKAIRGGHADLSDGFARIQNGQVLLKNVFIPPYAGQANYQYNPKQDRKLLLHKKQIHDLSIKVSKSAVTLIPLSLYDARNMIKVELALAASKKKFDKRRVIKARDEARKIEQEIKWD